MLCPSSSTSFDNLDESLPGLVYDNDDDTPDGEQSNPQSSLFSEINSLVSFNPLIETRNRYLFIRKQCQVKQLRNVSMVRRMILN